MAMAHSVIELTVPAQGGESCRKYRVEDEDREGETERKGVARDTKDSGIGKAVWACPAELSKGCFSQRGLWIERVIAVLIITIIWTLLAVVVVFFSLPNEVCCYIIAKRLGGDWELR